MSISLDHIQLAMPPGEESAARAFWAGIVGLEEIEKPPALKPRGGCWFRLGGAELHLGVEPGFAPAQKAHPGFCTDEIDALARRLANADHQVTWDNAITARKRFFTADPFGNRLEFLETP